MSDWSSSLEPFDRKSKHKPGSAENPLVLRSRPFDNRLQRRGGKGRVDMAFVPGTLRPKNPDDRKNKPGSSKNPWVIDDVPFDNRVNRKTRAKRGKQCPPSNTIVVSPRPDRTRTAKERARLSSTNRAMRRDLKPTDGDLSDLTPESDERLRRAVLEVFGKPGRAETHAKAQSRKVFFRDSPRLRVSA